MVGLTLERYETTADYHAAGYLLECYGDQAYLSLEPLIGSIDALTHLNRFPLVIIGAMSGPGRTRPTDEALRVVHRIIGWENVYVKNNMVGYLQPGASQKTRLILRELDRGVTHIV